MVDTLTIYGKPDCYPCKASVRKAEALGLAYRYVDVTADPEVLAYLQAQGFRGVPVVMVGDQSWAGFRPDLFDAVLQSGETR